MKTNGPTAFEIILWVALANVLLFLTAYGLVSWWRKTARETVAYITEQIKGFADRIGAMLNALQMFDGTTAEPYVSPINALSQEVEQTGQQTRDLQAENQRFYEEMNTAAPNQLQAIINAPYHWWMHWQHARSLRATSKALDARLAAAETQIKHIDELPWEIATQARAAEQQVMEAVRLSQTLRQQGLRGKTLFAILSQVPYFQNTLKKIPDAFLRASQDDLIAAANQDDTIAAFESTRQLHPELEKWLPRLREWNDLYELALQEQRATQQTLDRLQDSLSQPMNGLQVAPLTARLEFLSEQYNALNTRLTQPEVEQLKSLQREATRLRKLAEDAGQQLVKAGQRATEVTNVLTALASSQTNLSAQASALQQHPIYPLTWDESGSVLSELRQRLAAFGAPNRARTLEEMDALLQDSTRIKTQQQDLAARFPKVLEQHTALTALLERPELKEGAAWARKTRDLIALAAPYDAKNWPRPDTITTLQTDLDALVDLQTRLIPPDTPATIKESNLTERLKETQALASAHKGLRARVDSVRARLEKIQAVEAESKEIVSGAWSALERVAILAENNELLHELAAADIKRLSEDLKTTAKSLNEPGQGVIEKKAQQIQRDTGSVAQAMNAWLVRMNSEITSTVRQINDQLITLDNITSLEDNPVKDARSLIMRDEVRGEHAGRRVPTGGLGRKQLSEQDASVEIKRKYDLLVTVQSAQQALNALAAPLLSVYQEALAARDQARERMSELTDRVPQRHAWPPMNQAPIPDDQGQQPLTERWDALKKQPQSVDDAITELRRLQQQYRKLTERAAHVLERIDEDQDRITEVEEKISSLQQDWELMAQSSAENQLLVQGIQQLLSKTDSQIAFIHQQYMVGALDYGEVLRSLQLLYDEIFTARVPVDTQQDTGLVDHHPRRG